jgi:hypothetical protein
MPRFNAATQRIEDERKVAAIVLEVGEAPPDSNGRVWRRSADGHNKGRRRGLPVISKGISGTSPGMDLPNALLAKEARGELRLSARDR